jgi:hypothetical protein
MWQVRGAVVAVQDSSVRVRHKSGQVVALTIDNETAYFSHKQPASFDQVKVGARVTVDVQRAGGLDRAVRVQIF